MSYSPKPIEIPESVHAILSASKSATWLTCAGALGASKSTHGKPASKYAAEGTAYHDVARRALTEGLDCTTFVGDRYKISGFEFTVDEANAAEAQKYVDLVRSLPGQRMIEVDVDYSALLGLPKLWKAPLTDPVAGPDAKRDERPVAAGSADAVVIDYEHHVIYVVDLKFGRGDIVYALKNSQMRLYAAGAISRYRLLGIEDDWLVKMTIAQPRANHFDEETLTVSELMAWVESIKLAAQHAFLIWKDGPSTVKLSDLTPSDKACRWCPLSGNCEAQNRKVLDQFPTGHAAAAIPNLVTLDDVQLATALDLTDEVEHWLSAVRAEGLARALQGHTLPNWKLVEGRRGNRSLNEEARVALTPEGLTELGIENDGDEGAQLPVDDAIYFALKDGAYQPKKLKSVSQLQKPLEKKAPLLWAALQACVTQPDGRPALERIEDPRPPMTVVSSEFPIAPTAGGII